MSIENYGSYQLLKRLATGGMAQIYLARQKGPENFEKLLVVKRILPHLAENSDFIRMFLDEARIAARLNHPNIVQIFNLGAQDDSYFIAMEYIHGEDLRRIWKRSELHNKPFPHALICRVIMDACAGLDYAHKKPDTAGKPLNIVHRDISPQNILVTFDGGVKVVDFGIAKAADQATITRSGVLKGKYSYMSPEQANGKKLDCRSDIFALGVVLYEVLTGQRLFKRGNDIQTLNAVTEADVPPPSTVNPRIPRDLDAVVMKALAKRPDERFQEARDLQMALEEFLLAHKLASSSAHLATFMSDLYADRLEQERKAGAPVIEAMESHPRMLESLELSPGGAVLQPPSSPTTVSRSPRHASGDGRLPKPPPARIDEPSVPSTSTTLERVTAPRSSDGMFRDLLKSAEAAPHTSAPRQRTRSEEQPMTELLADDGGATVSLQQRDLPPEVGELSLSNSTLAQSMTTESGRGGRFSQTLPPPKRTPRVPPLPLVISIVALIGIGVTTYALATRKPTVEATAQVGGMETSTATATAAEISVTTEPAGASLIFDGAPVVGSTPAVLPAKPRGRYVLVVSKPGFVTHRAELDVPAGGKVELPLITLSPDRRPTAPVPVGTAPVGTTPGPEVATGPVTPPPAPAQVTITIKAQPEAAAVVDGKARGTTPVTVTAAANSSFELELARGGYRPLKQRVAVGAAAREERFTLVPVPAVQPPQPPHARAKGKVRFAVTPWANVSCGSFDFGPTPFADKELPVGTYECRFTNPDYRARTETIEVRANTVSKVSVKLK